MPEYPVLVLNDAGVHIFLVLLDYINIVNIVG